MPRNVVIFERLMYAMIALGVGLMLFDSARIAALSGVGASVVLIASLLGLAVFGLPSGLPHVAARTGRGGYFWLWP